MGEPVRFYIEDDLLKIKTNNIEISSKIHSDNKEELRKVGANLIEIANEIETILMFWGLEVKTSA